MNGKPDSVTASFVQELPLIGIRQRTQEVSCQTCIHFDGEATCPAYPNGVPMTLYLGIKKHLAVLPCQDGELTWEGGIEESAIFQFGDWTVEAFCPPNCDGPPRGPDGKE